MKIIITFLIMAATVFLGGFYYYGGLSNIRIEERTLGPFIVIYEKNNGDYQKSNMAIKKLIKMAQENGVSPQAGFGMYQDVVSGEPQNDMQNESGIIINNQDAGRLQHILDETVHQREISSFEAIMGEFPFKGTASMLLGVWKVYPRLSKYLAGKRLKKGASFEIYDMAKKKTIYAMSVRK